MTGDLDFGTLYTINNVRDPVLSGDIVTKGYADINYSGGGGGGSSVKSIIHYNLFSDNVNDTS